MSRWRSKYGVSLLPIGFQRYSLTCITGTSWAQRIRTGGVGQKARSMGIATEAELEDMAKAWEEWAVTEDACYACLHGEILVRK